MKAIALVATLGLIACVSAGILSPYVGYGGYYASAPVVSRTVIASPYVSSYVSPYVSSYVSPYASHYVAAPIASPIAYSSRYIAPYSTYSYLLKK